MNVTAAGCAEMSFLGALQQQSGCLCVRHVSSMKSAKVIASNHAEHCMHWGIGVLMYVLYTLGGECQAVHVLQGYEAMAVRVGRCTAHGPV